MVRRILCAGLLGALLAGAAGVGLAGEETERAPVASSKAGKGNPVILMETTLGTIKLELNPEKAPKTVENFLAYVNKSFFNGTIFHRVINDFMIQGGGFTEDMNQKKTDAPILLESKNGLKNLRGTIAMARTSDPNSATSQFFINHKDNPALDYPKPDGNGYAVFGKVIEGLDIVDKIAKVETASIGMHQNVPSTPVVIKSVKVAS